jgi:hypothetical protein
LDALNGDAEIRKPSGGPSGARKEAIRKRRGNCSMVEGGYGEI